MQQAMLQATPPATQLATRPALRPAQLAMRPEARPAHHYVASTLEHQVRFGVHPRSTHTQWPYICSIADLPSAALSLGSGLDLGLDAFEGGAHAFTIGLAAGPAEDRPIQPQ